MEEILIKKYDNRRLYCVNEGRYVSLSEIRDFVKEGRSVRVVEKTGGRDITKYILTQVLLEERCEFLPEDFFHLMIQSKPVYLEFFFRDIFPQMLGAFAKWRDAQVFPAALPGFPGAKAFPWMDGGASGFGAAREAPGDPPGEPAAEAGRGRGAKRPARKAKPEAQDPPAEGAMMAQLLKRIADLEKKVGRKK